MSRNQKRRKSNDELSYAAADNWGLTQQNPYGLVLLRSTMIKNLTIGFPSPLRFQESLRISVTVKENDVVQIVASVVYSAC